MKSQQAFNYQRVEAAINFIKENYKTQPSLNEIAAHVAMSASHFQRLFVEWAGVSPKQFISYLTVSYAKSVLKHKPLSLFDAALDVGLSGTGRLHDLFVKLEGMRPGEYKNGGSGLKINFSFSENLFGRVLIASTTKGVCYLSFIEEDLTAIEILKSNFPNALFIQTTDEIQYQALKIFSQPKQDVSVIPLHLKGTAFQLKVWEALLKIPEGKLSSYLEVSKSINSPTASRAVGNAIGNNPIAFIIPCHRVIRNNGQYGDYRWGSTRKSALIGWEACQVGTTDLSATFVD